MLSFKRISLAILALLFSVNIADSQTLTRAQEGLRTKNVQLLAITNATIIPEPGKILNNATIIIRNGRIEAVGAGIEIPKGADVRDGKGLWIYPAFVEAYSDAGMPKPKRGGGDEGQAQPSNSRGAKYWNEAIKPEQSAADIISIDEKTADDFKKAGFAAIHVNSMDGVMRGASALVLAKTGSTQEILLKNNVSQWFSFKKGSSRTEYPESLMGVIALIRQTLIDADWYSKSHSAFDKNSSQIMPEVNVSLQALTDALKSNSPIIFETQDDPYSITRAANLVKEFSLKNVFYKGSGYEYQRLANVAALKPTLILPLNFPATPDVGSPDRAMDISLAELMHWDAAPSNPYLMDSAGVTFAFTASGLKDKSDLFKNIRKAIERGLEPETALAALTTIPAIICHAENLVGTLSKGKLANMIVTNGELFKSETVIQSMFLAGEEDIFQKSALADVRGKWTVTPERILPKLSINIDGKATSPSAGIAIDSVTMNSFKKPNIERSPELKPNDIGREEEAQQADSLKISNPVLKSTQLGGFKSSTNLSLNGSLVNFTVKGDTLGLPGVIRFTGTMDSTTGRGKFYLPNGEEYAWTAVRDSAFKEKDVAKKDEKVLKAVKPQLVYPFGPYGLKEMPKARTVLLKNATVWTSAAAGVLQETDVVINNGKIAAIGKNLGNTPADTVIDATGKHITPGIIDEHSHIAITGGVNEGSHANTAEVRIGDVLDPDDVNIYRQLSGGVTSSHLLHGSANPVGGQLQFIKLRWGADADGLKFQNVDPTIKFALGENVKQSNWGDQAVTRYPQTRMGVEEIMRDGFRAALEYEKSFKNYNSLSDSGKQNSTPPRKDIQLETMLEIIRGKRFIHCHSYVQSEILMLMRVAEDFGFKVKTFTHILEGYKVASEMAKHGAMASTFADWWAYKFEVYDAIPQNAGIMHETGVVVSINSDDAEMARRLNQEAAKAAKYSAVPEEDALKMVTINAARQMNVQDRTGSLEVGKDADIVVWSGHPLSNFSKVEETFVDGKLYFSIDQDRKIRERDVKLRAELEQKALAGISGGDTPSRGPQRMMKKLEHCNDKEDGAFGAEHE
ncbi:MAG: amidohydrolase family protein [Bacteroidota bacterium]